MLCRHVPHGDLLGLSDKCILCVQVILEMLATRPAVRKQEVVSAAKEKGLALSDAQYSKAIKEICQSKAAVWTLKPGYAGGVGS